MFFLDKSDLKTKLMNSYAILLIAMGVVLYFFVESEFGYRTIRGGEDVYSGMFYALLPGGLIFSGVSFVLLNYLRGAYDKGGKGGVDNSSGRYYEKIKNEVSELKGELELIREGRYLVNEDDRAEILKKVQDSISIQVSRDVVSLIEDKYSEDVKRERYLASITKQFDLIRHRLLDEIESLGRKGNLNLVIGGLTTVAAVLILASTVLPGETALSSESLFSYYVPRVTLSVFIEIFSFFFLGLYKSGQAEIKYFQNELTNAEFKFVAIQKAILVGHDDSIDSVIKELVLTERNFKLGKGESTVELEKIKNDKDSLKTILDSVTKIVNSKKG